MKTALKMPAFGRNAAISAVLILIALVIPLFVRTNYTITVLVNCFAFGAFGLAWNLISGYGGQVSWCHSSFAAIGAYTSILAYDKLGISPFISLIPSIMIAYILATVIGSISFRYRGPFFSITTIALGEIVRVLLLYFVNFTGGSRGISVRYTAPSFWNLMFQNNTPCYYIMLAAVIGMIVISLSFERSKIGYYLRSINADEDAAIYLGINTGRVKLQAFQISAVLTAALGVLYGFFQTFIEPNTICSVDLSVKIGSVAIVGGVGTPWGAAIGAFVIILLTELATTVLGSSGGAQLMYGLALIIVVIFQPKGISHLFKADLGLFRLFRPTKKNNT